MRVLKEESRNKHKFEVAKAYCNQNSLTTGVRRDGG